MPKYAIKSKITLVIESILDPEDFENFDGDPDDGDAVHDFFVEEMQDSDNLQEILSQEGFSVEKVDLKSELAKG